MADKTRRVHVVRCKDPNNSDTWVDVKVLDKIVYYRNSGGKTMFTQPTTREENLLEGLSANVIPYIVDDTPGGPHAKGGANKFSRRSHMKRMVNPDDPTQMLDAEILDSFAYRGTNGRETGLSCSVLKSKPAIIDPTGHGLDIAPDGNTSIKLRCDQIVKDATPGASGGATQSSGAVGASGAPYLITERVEKMAWKGTNAEENIWLCPQGDLTEIDSTKYTTDAEGNKVPPDNTDQNVYISFPDKDHGGPSSGPWLGKGAPLRQGPLWWVVNAHGGHDLYALFCVSLDLGYLGQAVGDFRIFIHDANFPVFGDGTIWHYPYFAPPFGVGRAAPDNAAAGAPIPQPEGAPRAPSITNTIYGNLDDYFKYYYSWCLHPWSTGGGTPANTATGMPGFFGSGGVNVFGINLTKVRALLGRDNTGYDKPITFTVSTEGIPDRTDIGAFTYSYLDLGFGGIVADHLGGTGTTPVVTPGNRAPQQSPGFVLGQIAPVQFDSTTDYTNFVLAALGFYTVSCTPPFQFFSQDHSFFYFNDSLGSPDIVPYIKSTASVNLPIVALHNTFTETGNYFSDPGFAPIINVSIGPRGINPGDPDNRIDLSGSFGSNENNFQLFGI